MQRSIGAYPVVEIGNKPDVEDIFRTFKGQDMVVVGQFIRQKYMLSFWCILHLIFKYDIEPSAHTTECPTISSTTVLPHSLLMTDFLHSVGCMDSPEEERNPPLDPIYQTTLTCFEAQLRWQQIPRALTAGKPQQVEEPSRRA
ncbi:hypothetical protein CJ030_MR1G025242 [Morella rubra]|uniref:Uncharacterized protein n=1 Tax=Morella rubra TaxID=262757 RepID=A0A6A1WL45_9ROSI|nr:hypothetical protein CJ030_MR1G025242 [Morella rubra]